MRILITPPSGNQSRYRIDFGNGGLQFADTEDQAVSFASGVQAGWEAARLSVDKCHAYEFAILPVPKFTSAANPAPGVEYEWDVETVDDIAAEDPDILDHDHYEKLSDIKGELQTNQRLVLVKNDPDGCRAWAYVENGRIYAHFMEADGKKSGRVPDRYRHEFNDSRFAKV